MQLIDDIRTLRRLGKTPVKTQYRDGKELQWEPWKDPNWKAYKEANDRVPGWLCIILLKFRII